MARVYRAASYLLRRGASWYFRLRLPSEIQSAAGRVELRLSLQTSELAAARIRAGQLLPFVFALKRLTRLMAQLTPDIAKQVLDHEFARLTDALHRAHEPWRQPESAIPTGMVSAPMMPALDLDEPRRWLVKRNPYASTRTSG